MQNFPPDKAEASSVPITGPTAGPIEDASRITSLDLIRGVAVLGILFMNVVSFKYGQVPYWNLSAGGSETWIDWAVGIFGEVFVDQKFMGLFSLLFGAGVMLFIDRASRRERHPVWLNLWRNLLLLGIGLLHYLLWEGDVLMLYAVSSAILICFRKLSARTLIVLGAIVFLLPVPGDLLAQTNADSYNSDLTGIWTDPGAEIRDPIGLFMLSGYFARGLGMIMIGAGLFRLGFIQGECSGRAYTLFAVYGTAIGLALAALGVVLVAWNDFSREVAFIGNIPNSLGTIPAAMGYMSLIVLWNKRKNSWLKSRLSAAGRMALTNYLAQSVLGILILTVALGDFSTGRSGLLVFVVGVWAVQLWWSQAWLSRFRFGPAEWLWRVATYRRRQPLRRY